MRVMIEAITGTLFYVQVEDDATVGDLKREIGTQEKLPQDRLILLHSLVNHDDHSDHQDGPLMMMEDTLALVDYGVQDGSHIHLCFNPLDDASSHYHFLFTAPDSLLW